MKTGKVKWYNETKGYGFIESNNGEDIFVHRSGISNNNGRLDEGQEVEYDTQTTGKGLAAVNVKSLN